MKQSFHTRVHAVQPKTSRKKTRVEPAGSIVPPAHRGELESISIRQCEKALFMGFDLVLGNLGEDSRKQDIALDWMLSGSGVIL